MSDLTITISDVYKSYKHSNNISSAAGVLIQVKTSKGEFYVVPAPTSNCQVMSFYNLQGILCTSSKPEYNINKDDFKLILGDIKRDVIHKHLIICDIKTDYCNVLDKLIEECGITVIFKNPYVSTNGSNMCMYLINTKNIPMSEKPATKV